MSDDIFDLVHRATGEMIGKFSKELTTVFKNVLAENGMISGPDIYPGDLDLDYDTMGWTTVSYKGQPIIRYKMPVIEVSKDGLQLTYKWEIRKIKK